MVNNFVRKFFDAQLNQPTTSGAVIGALEISGVQHQKVLNEFSDGAGGVTVVSAANPSPVTDATLAAKDFATQTTLAAVLAKLSADPATQTTLAAILAKIIAAPSTEAQQISANALLTTIAAISQPLTDTQLRATPVPISGTVAVSGLPAGLATSANQTTEISGLAALLAELQLKADLTETQPVSLASIPLATGAATSAKQDTGNTSLASIDGKITAVNTGAVVVSSSALPTGASTAARQDTGNTSLSTVAGAVSGTEMQVDVVAALPAGNNNIGDVDVASIAAGDNNIGNVDIVTMPNVVVGSGTLTAVTAITNPVTVAQATAANLNMTEASAAAILAKIIAAPATEAKQDSEISQLTTLNAKDFATQTTLAAFFAALGLSQGGDATDAVGPMVQGLVSDTPNSYFAGNVQPISLTPEGRLRVSAVDAYTGINFFPTVNYDPNIFTNVQDNPYNF